MTIIVLQRKELGMCFLFEGTFSPFQLPCECVNFSPFFLLDSRLQISNHFPLFQHKVQFYEQILLNCHLNMYIFTTSKENSQPPRQIPNLHGKFPNLP